MAKIHINKRFDNRRTIEADHWEVAGGFVTFYRELGSSQREQVLTLRERQVWEIEREG